MADNSTTDIIAGLPVITMEMLRPYWATQLTDFAVSIKAAKDLNEPVPDIIVRFVTDIQPWINASNGQNHLTNRYEFHTGRLPNRTNMTGLPRWYERRGNLLTQPGNFRL